MIWTIIPLAWELQQAVWEWRKDFSQQSGYPADFDKYDELMTNFKKKMYIWTVNNG